MVRRNEGQVVVASPLLQLPNTYRAFYGAFTALRPFQQQVIAPILQRQDLILQAATGSGKTAAVLAPCLERRISSGTDEAILYVIPTRALAHDLRRRLEPILHERLNLRLGIRIGDVKRLPGGQADVLLTTPESLDVMLGSSNREVKTLLQHITTCIVDEAHQLVQGYRGCQLAYLLQRLERRSHHRLQKIALSATLAGPQTIRDALSMQPQAVWLGDAVQRQIQPYLIHLQREQDELVAFINDLAMHYGYRKLLLFANSRSRCDRLFALLRQRSAFQQATYLHYSNLKARQRQEVERQFQRRTQALCIATSTLELGIDVGDVDGVILYEPPESVTTFLQRLGRGNRQQQHTTFWGICRGPNAGEQLLQFVALYNLAQQGTIETLRSVQQPSVLVQQVLSHLYAHKRVTLPMLQAIFPQQAETIEALLPELAARRWLRRLDTPGAIETWRGGRRYAQALIERQIWSNFPATEVSYTLQVDDEAVADLPISVVRQLEVGDQVDLAGRRLRILTIQEGERSVVRAVPVETSEDKEILWLGSGPAISWEVAQAVRPLLQPDYEPDTALTEGLFSRTRTLLHHQQQRVQRQVVLHNGIALSRTPQGLYRYATYLGSIGNLILQRTIEAYYRPQLEDFSTSADALAVECSHRIDLQCLPLPIGRDALQGWAARNVQALQALFALNTFCRALPKALLIDELTNWLWDERLSQAFAHYRQHSSAIAEGDPRHLEWDDGQDALAFQPDTAVLQQGPQPAVLSREKNRLGLATDAAPHLPSVPAIHQTPRALTGTMLGNYIQHQQCHRTLSFDLLPFAQQPPKRTLVDTAPGAVRAERGRTFEASVLADLAQQGTPLYQIGEQDDNGQRLSLQRRQELSFTRLADMIQACAKRVTEQGNNADPYVAGYLAQAVLIVPALFDTWAGERPSPQLSPWPGRGREFRSRQLEVEGIGIPDLIEVTLGNAAVRLTIADIKDSAAPRYSQKWQVAFYAALLQQWVQQHTFELPVQIDPNGVLITRPEGNNTHPVRNTFDLTPYLAALPMLAQHIASLLDTPPLDAVWQLRPHCTSCAYLDTCYRQALSTDDVMLTPHLTAGEHLKLRSAGLHTLAQATDWAEADDSEQTISFSPQQVTRLRARLRALAYNRVELLSDTTERYPANISSAIFIHLLRDSGNGQPRVWGLQRWSEQTAPDTPLCWIAASEADIATCQQDFVTHLQRWWQEAISTEQGPHLFTFGTASLRCLQDSMADGHILDILWSAQRRHHTDLRQLLRQHVALPIPLHVNLATVAHVWGLNPPLTSPPYLIQDEADEIETLLPNTALHADHVTQLQAYMQTHLHLQQQLWQRFAANIHSDWQQSNWNTTEFAQGHTLEHDCVTFLEQQQDWRQRDILTLQQCSLAERVERYRALGPLTYQSTSLDDEGRFLYHFELPQTAILARFRVGDFLKLNPLGNPDLQEGSAVILAQYEPHARHLAVISRQRRLVLNSRLRYSLDEDIEDWTTPRLLDAVRQACTPGEHPQLTALLAGDLPLQHAASGLAWAQRWVQQLTLNARQRDALLLPFRSRLGLIEGPPGTGKTHLLACMLIALILQAQQTGRPLRIVVSALTHQAIDNVLLKVQQLLTEPFAQHFSGRCLKWGRRPSFAPDQDNATALTYIDNPEEILQTSYLILGATGYGLYNLFDSQSGAFPAFFDWVIFDEASQVIVPQAMLSLLYGKGQYIFCGDTQQLPPVILGPQNSDDDSVPCRSILSHLHDAYDASPRVRLNETYRLNRELCQLPSRLWYQGDLRPTSTIADARLVLPAVQHDDLSDAILSPDHPVTLVLADHESDHQQSMAEVEIIASLATRLLLDHALTPERLAIVAPHRAQNNAIAQHLAHLLLQRDEEAINLPVIDTVERLQGAERDVILFSLTTSDPDHRDSPFLNNPNRFNVAITRARHKLIVVGSTTFFTQIPTTEAGLQAHYGFRSYYEHCREQNALFNWQVKR